MEKTIKSLQYELPRLKFTPAKHFSWSPETQEILYVSTKNSSEAVWSLLHETGHALLEHKRYQTDFELLKLEISAWEKAEELAKKLKITISSDHIQDCLDTYRDWLHRRSTCPACSHISTQQTNTELYRCFNCQTTWRVTPSRFCRSYRSIKNTEKSSRQTTQAVKI